MGRLCLGAQSDVAPQQLPILWSYLHNRAIVSYTSNIPENDLGNYPGLYVAPCSCCPYWVCARLTRLFFEDLEILGLGNHTWHGLPELVSQWC